MRRFGIMPILTCPCWHGAPLWVGCIQDEVPSAGRLRPTFSVFPITAIRKYVFVIAFWQTSLLISDVLLSEFVVDLDKGYFRRNDYETACSAPCLSLLVLAGILPRFGSVATKMRYPLRGNCGPARFIMYCDTRVQLRICILGTSLYEIATFVIDLYIGYWRRNDYESACSVAQRRYL